MMRSSSQRYLELDALRGLCVIAVLLSHYTTVYDLCYAPAQPALFHFPWVAYRVQIFCMISGFAMAMIMEKTTRPLDFVVARVTRLYPSYAVAVIFSAILVTVFALPFKSVTLPQVLVNLTMLQEWFDVKNVEGSYWYLAPEISFYALISFLLLIKKTAYIEKIGLAGLIMVILWFLPWPGVIVHTQLLFLWHLFFAGILFYQLKTKGESWQRHAGLALCFVVQNLITDDMTAVLCLAGSFLLFYLFIYGQLKWLVNGPLVYLGTISYSLFLIHENMGWIIIRRLHEAGAGPWPRLLLPVAASLVLASALTFGIERPAMRYLRERYQRRLKRP